MIYVYVNGCSTCGIMATLVRKVQAYGASKNIDVEVLNSKYNEHNRIEHARLLNVAGMKASDYTPIVVEELDSAQTIEKLREWQP